MSKLWYLVGPMTACYYTAHSWRTKAKRRLACIDPYEVEAHIRPPAPHKNLFEYYKCLREAQAFSQLRKEFQTILALNAESVDRAFGLLCYEPYPQRVSSWGTIKEIVRGYERGKPIVLWTEVPTGQMNFTAIAMSTVICRTLREAIRACKRIEGGCDA